MNTLNKGDVIVLSPEWMDPGDEQITFVAVADYKGEGRIYMSDRDSTMHIVPVFTLRREDMVNWPATRSRNGKGS